MLLFVGGLDLGWSDGTEDVIGHGNIAASFEVPLGEHVSYVVGNFGWYVDNLIVISSSGKPLGEIIISFSRENSRIFLSGPPTGGDGGSFKTSLAKLNNRHKDYQVFLDGISVCEVNYPLVSLLSFNHSG